MKAHGLCNIIVLRLLLFEDLHVWLQKIITLTISHACKYPHFANQIFFIFQIFIK